MREHRYYKCLQNHLNQIQTFEKQQLLEKKCKEKVGLPGAKKKNVHTLLRLLVRVFPWVVKPAD